MGFLSPLFLVAAALVAVPLVLHLFHRHRAHRVAFPALRYLQRTERDHARRIRLRQLLLLVIRCAVILLLVTAGARLFVPGRGGAHPPTALAIVIDNSLSTGRVAGTERVLDGLLGLAAASVRAAGPEDRIWVLRAGEPWDVAVPGGREEALRRVTGTEASAAAGDLGASLERAHGLVTSAGLPGAEIHLLSDLQATGFGARPRTPTNMADVPVVAWLPPGDPPPNHWIEEVDVGGGLPPLANQRTDLSVRVGGEGVDGTLPVRVVIGGRVRAAATTPLDGSVLLPVGPFPPGLVHGWVETDPDALDDDDRRHFSFQVRPPARVALSGPPSFFLEQGLQVLEEVGRARAATPADADVLFAVAGAGAEPPRAGRALVVVPPADPSLLPALNRRLASAGIPWRYSAPDGRSDAGEVPLGESRIPLDLADVRVLRHYGLAPTGAPPPSDGSILLRLADGAPFLLEGRTVTGPYLLMAAPPEPEWTTLPVAAAMVPFLEWTVSRVSAPGGGSTTSVVAGDPISTPPGATHVETPGGTRFEVDGTRSFARTREAGIHTVLRGDSVLERVAVVVPVSESRLARLDEDALEAWLGGDVIGVSDADGWSSGIFAERQGPELWRPLLLAALALLLVESAVAAAGSIRPPRRGDFRPTLSTDAQAPDAQEPKQARAPVP